MLWLALAARNSGTRASSLAGIEDEVAALDFDLCCTLRLLHYDNKRAKAQNDDLVESICERLLGKS